jgi:hypothetical protein
MLKQRQKLYIFLLKILGIFTALFSVYSCNPHAPDPYAYDRIGNDDFPTNSPYYFYNPKQIPPRGSKQYNHPYSNPPRNYAPYYRDYDPYYVPPHQYQNVEPQQTIFEDPNKRITDNPL